ncbi:MAG: hypothetical protein H0S85_03110 [Desulfovibrionaceae bacterium]|jgi:hypothetical protein|nr:hypothetical protein [Desulfovibrionaceae bacterium]
MARTQEFYTSYVRALFRRGKADTLPNDYIETEAAKVLRGEMDDFRAALDRMVASGMVSREGDSYTLHPEA